MNEAPENRLLAALVAGAEALAVTMDEAIGLLGEDPLTEERFASLGLIERTASAALLKRIEQLQDVLSRLFRTTLIAQDVDISNLYARDIANRMEKSGAIADAEAWMSLVKLRNRLVHEYPLTIAEQRDRVSEAMNAAPTLRAILDTLRAYLVEGDLLP